MGIVGDIGAVGVGGAIALVFAFVLWLLGHQSNGPSDPDDDPHAPDKDGFTPADKYGYGYDYSWGDAYGDPDL